MKKTLLITALAASVALFAESALLKGYKSKDYSAICSENFNSGAPGWLIPEGFSIKNKDGMLTTPALHGVAKTKKNLPSALCKLKITPGSTYRITLQYRVKNLQTKVPKQRRASIILGSIAYKNKAGKTIHKNFWDSKSNASNNWTKYYTTIKIPDDARPNAELKIHFDWWHTGEIWYEEILVESADLNSVLIPVKPYNSAMEADGKVAFQGYFYAGEKQNYKDLKLYLNVEGKEYLTPANQKLYFETKIQTPKKDYFNVTAKMLNTKTKEILTEYTCRLSTAKKNPKVGTRLDEKGRMWKNGKKILPLGFFTYQWMKEEDYKRLKENGFNFVSFGIRYRNVKGENSNTPEKMNETLNYLSKYDLNGILQLVLMVPGKERTRLKLERNFGKETTAPEIVRYLGESIKNNPNLIGYYLSDENPRMELPSIRRNREILSKADPNHITLTLTNNPDDFTVYAPTGDVLVYDNYPFGIAAPYIPRKDTLEGADKAFKLLLEMGTPWWFCTQAYDKAVIRGITTEKMPTEKELTSLALLAAIYNAKGYYYYSYHEMFVKGNRFDPNHSKKMWPRVAASGKLLNRLAPYILGDKDAPAMKISSQKNIVRGRRFIADNGKEIVMLVSIHPKEAAATFQLPNKKYKSLTGVVVKGKNNTWTFKSKGIDYDVLIEE